MKYTISSKIRTIAIILNIFLVLFYTVNITTDASIRSEKQSVSILDENLYLGHTFIYTLNGKSYLAEYITEENVGVMKKETLFENTREHSAEVIDGHGTGYLAPSKEELDALVGKVSLLELIADYEKGYKATADISSEIYFPVVGDQGMQGSCTSWANVYYAYGYLEAKDYGWDASSGNPQYLLSPAWSYNKIAAYDYGSVPSETAELIKEWGVSTLYSMPYDDTDVDSWGDEAAWRESPYHRPLDYTLISYTGYATIDVIKSLLDSGIPVTFGIDSYQFSNGLSDTTSDFILSSAEYNNVSGLNHAQCFVGYDDSISEESDVGAFRVVNSWGDWMDEGFYWLTYDAFNEFGEYPGQQILFITDRIDYNPDIIATWEFSSSPTRMSDIITLGVGAHSSPLDLLNPHYDADINNLFPEYMAFDISDFYSYYLANNDELFYLEIGPSDTAGTISSFKLEKYSGGILQQISQESPDTPKDTPGYVIATFMSLDHELKAILSVPTDPSIFNSYSIKTMVINNGLNSETSINFDLLLNGFSVHSVTIPSLPIGANTTITYLWTPIEYDVYNFTAYVTPVPGEIYISNNQDTEILYILGPIFYDNFESGLSKWGSITGLWHLTDDTSAWLNPYHSPKHSMWFGNETTGNYDTGLQETGDLISIPFNLSDATVAFVEFYHWREGEGSGYDVSFLYISVDGMNWDLIYNTDESYIMPWKKVSVDISSYVGNPSVQLRFTFDTLDSIMNDYRGWLVDDVSVMSTGVEIPHNIRVSLDVPENPELFNTYAVNATVTNIGTSSESDVYLYLYLDGVSVYSSYYPSFPIYSSQGFSYMWTPTYYGEYNFTAYAVPVPGEEFIYDNIAIEIVPLHELILFDGMYINYMFEVNTYTGSTQVSYTQISEFKFHIIWDGILSGIPLLAYWDVDSKTRVTDNSGGNFYFGDGTHTPIWIFTDVNLGTIVPIVVDGEGDYEFLVTGETIYDIPGFGPVEAWQLEDLTGCMAYYEKSTGILLSGYFPYMGGVYSYSFEIISTNASPDKIVFDHDLRVDLELPIYGEIGHTYTINATVTNTGIYDESNIDLFLYLDDVLEDSIHISNLASGVSEVINFIWTPTNYGEYTFKAYAPTVIGETYTSDNTKIEIVPVHRIVLFDGMYINYSFTLFSTTYSLSYSYSYVSEMLFHVDYFLDGVQSGYWDVNTHTRQMTNAYGGVSFGEGTHTPIWIFTDVTLGEIIPIAVDSEGDHDFLVTGELFLNFPGFGPLEVWVLEDLNVSNGIAWYEKSTGILLNGTFPYYDGMYNYTFNILDSNALSKSLTIINPYSSSSWQTGTSQSIHWTSVGYIPAVKIELYKDGVFVTEIISTTFNDGEYSWSIPSTLTNSTQYQIKIIDVTDPLIYAFSDYFEIFTPRGIPGVPGYDLLIIIGAISIISLFVIKKRIKN